MAKKSFTRILFCLAVAGVPDLWHIPHYVSIHYGKITLGVDVATLPNRALAAASAFVMV